MKNTNVLKRIRISLLGILVILIVITIFFLYNSPNLTFYAIKDTNDHSFNMVVEIPESYQTIAPGKPVLFTAKILNLASQNRIDITLKFDVLDSSKNIIATKSETVAIETQASFVREIKIPESTPAGKYTLYTQLIYQDIKEAEAENSFKINSGKSFNWNYIWIGLPILIVIILLWILLPRSKKIIEHIKIKSKIQNIIKEKSRLKD